jgi:mRNA interferase MazF
LPRRNCARLILALLPGPYQNYVICGISTQLQQLQANWDERIGMADSDFSQSGLHQESAVRLSYLMAATGSEIAGTIGRVDLARLARLRSRLAARLHI